MIVALRVHRRPPRVGIIIVGIIQPLRSTVHVRDDDWHVRVFTPGRHDGHLPGGGILRTTRTRRRRRHGRPPDARGHRARASDAGGASSVRPRRRRRDDLVPLEGQYIPVIIRSLHSLERIIVDRSFAFAFVVEVSEPRVGPRVLPRGPRRRGVGRHRESCEVGLFLFSYVRAIRMTSCFFITGSGTVYLYVQTVYTLITGATSPGFIIINLLRARRWSRRRHVGTGPSFGWEHCRRRRGARRRRRWCARRCGGTRRAPGGDLPTPTAEMRNLIHRASGE